jgi:hypothetical protein
MKSQIEGTKKLTVLAKVLFIVLALILALAATAMYLYRDTIFRDRGDIDSIKSDNAISVLFVGNSTVFWGNVPRQLQTISMTHDVEITYKDISVNGASLSNSKDNALIEIQSGRYDYVVFQDSTRRPRNDFEGFLDDIRFLCDVARENEAIPVLYSPAWENNNGIPDEERQSILSKAYMQAANENNVILVNAGDAWIYAYKTVPGISLYAWDSMHANNAGAFLTACVFAATLFNLHIEEIPKNNRYIGSNAIDLAQAAWEFVHSSDLGR